MPELPDRPDIDQLRRQARDLHRAATAGVPDAVTRIRAVSDRMMLSTAQLAVAREYGFTSWPALRAEAERRRARLPAATRQFLAADVPTATVWAARRYSFGGGASFQTAEALLSPDVLTAGIGHAELHTFGTVSAPEPSKRLRREERSGPRFDDLTATDDRGAAYTVTFGSGSLHFPRPGVAQQRSELSFWVDPVPPADTSWIEVRARTGSATRLVPSPRAAVQVSAVAPVPASAAAGRTLEELAYWLLNLRHSNPSGDLGKERSDALARSAEIQQQYGGLGTYSELAGQLERLCGCLSDQHLVEDLPARWQSFLDGAAQADGPERHLDLAAAVPQLDGLSVLLDHLVSRPGSWSLYLRVKPTWWTYSEDGHRKWERASVSADDDRGGRYVPTFGGSSADGGSEELKLDFVPRIDPLARRLKLTFGAEAAEAVAELDLAPAAA
jgi:hypothetical protein